MRVSKRERERVGVNFINILRAAFMHADPESAKKLLDLTVFLGLMGSASVKAACRMLMKLNPSHRIYLFCLFNLKLGQKVDEPLERSLVAIDPEEIDLKNIFLLFRALTQFRTILVTQCLTIFN